jgi:hypothetical protein
MSYLLQILDSNDDDYTYQSSDAEADLHSDLSDSDSQHDGATAAGVSEENTDMADGEFTDMTDDEPHNENKAEEAAHESMAEEAAHNEIGCEAAANDDGCEAAVSGCEAAANEGGCKAAANESGCDAAADNAHGVDKGPIISADNAHGVDKGPIISAGDEGGIGSVSGYKTAV